VSFVGRTINGVANVYARFSGVVNGSTESMTDVNAGYTTADVAGVIAFAQAYIFDDVGEYNPAV
jgi:hypothetical protein